MRGLKQQGTHEETTSSFQLESCGVRIVLMHMHTQTHTGSRQGLALCADERRNAINNPPEVGNTKPSGWSLQHSLQFSFSSPLLSPLLLSPFSLSCPPLPSTLPIPTPSSSCPLNTVECFLLQLMMEGVCHF